MVDKKPIVFFEWRWLLMHPPSEGQTARIRPGIHHLLSLDKNFRLGIVDGYSGEKVPPPRRYEENFRKRLQPIENSIQVMLTTVTVLRS